MNAAWKTIDILLVLLAAAALLLCGFYYFQVASFAPDSYLSRVSELSSQAETVRAETLRRQQEQLQQEDYLASELSKLGDDGAALQQQIDGLRASNQEKRDQLAQIQKDTQDAQNIRQVAMDEREAFANAIRRLEDKINAGETDVRICYWTFDDGPSYNTEEVIDAARDMGIFVSFFTAREANENAANDDPEAEKRVLRKMVMNGDSVCNHTWSHQYGVAGNVYGQGLDSFREMVRKQDEWIYECTGIKPDIFRFPGGSGWAFSFINRDDAEKILNELGYKWIDWTCDLIDNAIANPSADAAYRTAMYQIPTLKIAMILSHDWNYNSVQAFKRAVPELQQMGYIFLPLFTQSWTFGNTPILFP